MSTPQKTKVLESAAFEYIERGVSVIPIDPHIKKPLIKWREYQQRTATEDEVADWQRAAKDHGIAAEDVKLAVITGMISGFVIVDCDNPDAVDACKAAGIWSPVRVRTKHGIHLYFRHPMDREYRPRVGSNSRGIDWPKIAGLDFRGDGSYALCPPSANYQWEVEPGFEIDDPSDWPVWSGWPMATQPNSDTPLFDQLDLTGVAVKSALSVWDATRQFVEERFPDTFLIPSDMGNGRNQRVLSFAAEQIMQGHWGASLDDRVLLYMDTFFEERLPDDEWKATCRSVEQMEKTNHPERFDADGNYLATTADAPPTEEPPEPAKSEEKKDPMERIEVWTADDLMAHNFPPIRWAVENLVPEGLTALVARPKMGKTRMSVDMALGVAMGGLCLGSSAAKCVAGDVLYIDLENGPRRMKENLRDFGARTATGTLPALARLTFWMQAPGLNDGLKDALDAWREKVADPRFVVIDVLQRIKPIISGKHNMNAYEADYKIWGPLQKWAKANGIAVLGLHHTRKGSDGDIMEQGSGSMGLAAVADNYIMLDSKGEGRTKEYLMAIRGREIPEELYEMDFTGGMWTLVGAKDDQMKKQYDQGRRAILDLLNQGPRLKSDILAYTGIKEKDFGFILNVLVSEGKVTRSGNYWTLI